VFIGIAVNIGVCEDPVRVGEVWLRSVVE